MVNLNNLYEEVLSEGTGKIYAEDLNLLSELKELKQKILNNFGNDDTIADHIYKIEERMLELFIHSNKIQKRMG